MKSADGPAQSTVLPCLLVESVEEELKFLQAVFDVTVQNSQTHERFMWQVEAKLGDTTLRIGRAHNGFVETRSALYVWDDDVDGTYARAMKAGATLISEPTDQPWGVREAGFRGPHGNIWWIGRRIGKLSNREVEEKLASQRRERM